MLSVLIAGLLLWAEAGADAYRRGVSLIEQGRPADAVEPLRAAVAADPANAQYQKALGVSFAMQKRYADADAPFERSCSLNPSLPDACFFFARNLYALDRYEASLAVLSRISKSARVLLATAQAEQALGRTAEAEKSFRAAIAASGQFAASDDPRVHFGSFLFREGRLAEALTVLRQLCEARPDSARGQLELGRVEMQLGQLAEAESRLTKAVQLGAGEQAELLLGKVRARRAAAAH